MPDPVPPHLQQPLRLSLGQQADLVDQIVGRCVMRCGDVAQETLLKLTSEEVDHLTALANRLRLMRRVEDQIRKLVTGR